MRASTTLSFALRSLKRAPLHSGLTALGVIVGIAAVVSTASIGDGAATQLRETLSKPDTRTIYVVADPARLDTHRMPPILAPADRLQASDYYAIKSSQLRVSAITPRMYVSPGRALANGRLLEVVVEGGDVDSFAINSRTLLSGQLFQSFDIRHATNVCVISESVARLLHVNRKPDGAMIRINDVPFRIIGTVDDLPTVSPSSGLSADLRIYVPFTSLARRVNRNVNMMIGVQASTIEDVGNVQTSLLDLMEQRRSARKSQFRVANSLDSIKTYADGSQTMARLLAAVGAISLIVGGIGIMNIMLVSVTERTREIGVRMAVGTRDIDILRQFLIEALLISASGGCIGILLGAIASAFVTYVNGWPTVVTPKSILAACTCSILVGVIFGYQPARRAASLNPVEALRLGT